MPRIPTHRFAMTDYAVRSTRVVNRLVSRSTRADQLLQRYFAYSVRETERLLNDVLCEAVPLAASHASRNY